MPIITFHLNSWNGFFRLFLGTKRIFTHSSLKKLFYPAATLFYSCIRQDSHSSVNFKWLWQLLAIFYDILWNFWKYPSNHEKPWADRRTFMGKLWSVNKYSNSLLTVGEQRWRRNSRQKLKHLGQFVRTFGNCDFGKFWRNIKVPPLGEVICKYLPWVTQYVSTSPGWRNM